MRKLNFLRNKEYEHAFKVKYKNEIKRITEELNVWINESIQNIISEKMEKLTLFYKKENVMEKFTETMKKEAKILKKLNILIIGSSGVGKSTLINSLLIEYLLKYFSQLHLNQ